MLIAGEAGVGKSYLGLGAAHDLATGGCLWGIPELIIPTPAPVLYIDQELGDFAFQKRVKEVYGARNVAPPSNIYVVSVDAELELDTPVGQKRLEGYIEESGALIVIVDVISEAMWGDESSNTDVRRVFQHLAKIQAKWRKEGLSVILLHHTRKPPASSRDREDYDPFSFHNVRGASKWAGSVDTMAMAVELPPSETAPGEWKRLEIGWPKHRHFEGGRIDKMALKEWGVLAALKKTALRAF